MRVLSLSLTAELEGRPLPTSPLVRTCAAPLAQEFSYELQPGASLPFLAGISGLSQLTDLVLTATVPSVFLLNGSLGAGIALEAGVIVIVLNLLDCTGDPLWQITNTANVVGRVRGVALGL